MLSQLDHVESYIETAVRLALLALLAYWVSLHFGIQH